MDRLFDTDHKFVFNLQRALKERSHNGGS